MSERLRALVLEDDVDFLADLLSTLAARPEWAPPSHAVDGVQAAGLLARDATPDVVVLSLDGDALRGRDLLDRVRQDVRFRGTAVVVTAANRTPGTERQAFLPGEVWMTKPFDVDDLLTAVRLAQARIAAEREPACCAAGG